jgi:hypothetical protein
MTELQIARKHGAELALGLGVRVFLYRDAAERSVFRVIHPADWSEKLELVETFEAPPRTIYEGALPPSAPAAS